MQRTGFRGPDKQHGGGLGGSNRNPAENHEERGPQQLPWRWRDRGECKEHSGKQTHQMNKSRGIGRIEGGGQVSGVSRWGWRHCSFGWEAHGEDTGGEQGALDLGLGELNEPWAFQTKSRRWVSLGVPC